VRRLLPFAFAVGALVAMTGLLHGSPAARADGNVPTTLTATTVRVALVVPTTVTPHPARPTAAQVAQAAHLAQLRRQVLVAAHARLVAAQVARARAIHAAQVRAAAIHAAQVRAAAIHAAQVRAAAAAAAAKRHHPPVTTTTAAPVTTTTSVTSTTDPTTSSTAPVTTTVPVTTTTVAHPTPQPKHIRRVGIATWYSYIPGRCATSWVPHGQRVYFRAVNSTHWFSCLVTDTQPRSPGRVLDLSMTQFQLLAPLAKGVVTVVVVW
jgi:hypothetical protein